MCLLDWLCHCSRAVEPSTVGKSVYVDGASFVSNLLIHLGRPGPDALARTPASTCRMSWSVTPREDETSPSHRSGTRLAKETGSPTVGVDRIVAPDEGFLPVSGSAVV